MSEATQHSISAGVQFYNEGHNISSNIEENDIQNYLKGHLPIGNEDYDTRIPMYHLRMKESPIPYEELVRAIQVDSRRLNTTQEWNQM